MVDNTQHTAAPADSAVLLESAMQRALDLAKLGPSPDPNPQVGAVILDDTGRIVAEGWHRGAGTKHAEVDALERIPAAWLDRTADLTAVVTLEPCNHTGKTGPCSEAIIKSGIGTVVYALQDPGPVSGGGAKKLRDHGVQVISGVLAAKSSALLSTWLTTKPGPVYELTTPYVICKWAQTLDGRVAAADGSSKWITGSLARQHVHAQRALADAILVGTGTIIADDPSLTARTTTGDLLVAPDKQPIPIIFGASNIPANAAINNHPALAANNLAAPLRINANSLRADLKSLKNHGINSIYVEGGSKTINTFLTLGVVSEIHAYIAPKLLGGPKLAIQNLNINTINEAQELVRKTYLTLGNDLLVIAKFKGEG